MLAKAPELNASPTSLFTRAKKYDLKIVDFGIFGSIKNNLAEKSNFGSLKYMAPEVLIGFNESTPKIDIWSLGIILHGLVLGFVPFDAKTREDIKKVIKEK